MPNQNFPHILYSLLNLEIPVILQANAPGLETKLKVLCLFTYYYQAAGVCKCEITLQFSDYILPSD